jgi:hypothetical protein
MISIITELLDATTQREVDKIVDKYLYQIPGCQRSKLCQFANNAKRRIVRIERLKKDSWKEQLN